MTLSRHTEVENLANLLGARRTSARAHASQTDAYLTLAASILQVPAANVASRLSSQSENQATLTFPTRISRAA